MRAKLTANGGEPGRCHPDPARAQRAMKAMLGMSKIDMAALQRAADGNA